MKNKEEIKRKKQADIIAKTQSKKTANQSTEPKTLVKKPLKKIIVLLITSGLAIPTYYAVAQKKITDISGTPAIPNTPIISNFKEPEMMPITGETFSMGSPITEKDRGDDETQHEVTVANFYMSKYETSNAEYVIFLNAVKKRGTEKQPWFATKAEDSRSQITGSVGDFKVEASYENYPAVTISWYGATAYAEWLSKETGKNYRLPTEGQWEYAARAGEKEKPFSTGTCISTKQANYNGNYPSQDCSKGEYRNATVEVNSFSANAYGLYNMHGNVSEWTCSEYDSDYNNEMQCIDKNNTQDMLLVLRSGSRMHGAQTLRSASRFWSEVSRRHYSIGFRLARM